MPKFTDLSVRSLPPGLHIDERMPGFGIRVGKQRRTWVVIKQPNRTKVALGRYPDLSLSDARRKAMMALATPSDTRPDITFPNAKEAYLDQPRWKESSKRVLKSSLRHFSWTRSISKITHEDVIQALDGIKGRSARAHAFKDLRALFNWCVPRYLAYSPCTGIRMEPQRSRARVLSPEELKRVWRAAEETDNPLGLIVRLLILTGQRKMEIGLLIPSQIADDTITLPAGTTKNGREHVLPIGPLARSLLPNKRRGYLFCAIGSERPYNGYTFHLKQLQAASKTKDWTLHDLRRTFATNLAALGVPIHVTEKLLNHVSGSLSGVAAIYNRHSYMREMREAVLAWEEALTALLASPEQSHPETELKSVDRSRSRIDIEM